jgi:hypothetical protein
MTLIATPDNTSLRAAAEPAAQRGTRMLSEAIQAVNDHRREVELRRMALAAQQSTRSGDWPVPVPRSHLHTPRCATCSTAGR